MLSIRITLSLFAKASLLFLPSSLSFWLGDMQRSFIMIWDVIISALLTAIDELMINVIYDSTSLLRTDSQFGGSEILQAFSNNKIRVDIIDSRSSNNKKRE